jgi:hypothetical protein
VHRVFLDPGGKHCVVTVIHPGGAESYYHHARWPRPKPLARLRGLLVNAVAWNRQSITEGCFCSSISHIILMICARLCCFAVILTGQSL